MMGHGFETDPLSGYLIGVSSWPQGTFSGYCPLFDPIEE
jgi:hypothetical protein